MMKKIWSAPVVEELSIDKTLGGATLAFFETDKDAANNIVSPFGTVPGARP